MSDKGSEEQVEDTALTRALQRFEEEKLWYIKERALLEFAERDSQAIWRLLMRKLGRY